MANIETSYEEKNIKELNKYIDSKIKLTVSELDKLFTDELFAKNISIGKYTVGLAKLASGKNFMKLLNYGFNNITKVFPNKDVPIDKISNKELIDFGENFYSTFIHLKHEGSSYDIARYISFTYVDTNFTDNDIELLISPKHLYDFIWHLGEYECRWYFARPSEKFDYNRYIHDRCIESLTSIIKFFHSRDPSKLNIKHTDTWWV